MRSNKDIDATLQKLGNLWKRYPALRLGQLIANSLQEETIERRDTELFYAEDGELLDKIASMNFVSIPALTNDKE